MASAASVTANTTNSSATVLTSNPPQNNNGLGRTTMRSNTNTKAGDLGRKQSPVDGVSRYVRTPFLHTTQPPLSPHCHVHRTGELAAVHVPLSDFLAMRTISLLIDLATDVPPHTRLGVLARIHFRSEAPWLSSKMEPILSPGIQAMLGRTHKRILAFLTNKHTIG